MSYSARSPPACREQPCRGAEVKRCSALFFPRLERSLGLLSPSLPPLIPPSPKLSVLAEAREAGAGGSKGRSQMGWK